jgi:hypothetical protein
MMWLLVLLTLAQPPYLAVIFHQCLYTIMVYPLMAMALRWGLRVSRRRPEPA